jgi:ubiquinone/menaquinone biosynthesis C-methylase UbiE
MKYENTIWEKIFNPKSKVLDCGCGTGYFMKRLSDSFDGNINVSGIDISDSAIQLCKRINPSLDVEIGDANDLKYSAESFDGILLISTIEHVENNFPLLKECNRVLKSGGHIFLTVHKKSIDPLIVPTLYNYIKSKIIPQRKNLNNPTKENKMSRPLTKVHSTLKNDFIMNGFELVEKKAIMSTFDWKYYRKIFNDSMIKKMVILCDYLNKYQISWYKNLEYQVWKKI